MMSESLFISGQGVYEALFLTDSVAEVTHKKNDEAACSSLRQKFVRSLVSSSDFSLLLRQNQV